MKTLFALLYFLLIMTGCQDPDECYRQPQQPDASAADGGICK